MRDIGNSESGHHQMVGFHEIFVDLPFERRPVFQDGFEFMKSKPFTHDAIPNVNDQRSSIEPRPDDPNTKPWPVLTDPK